MELDFSQPTPKPTTLEECHALIEGLWQFCFQLQKSNQELREELKQILDKEIPELKNEVSVLKKENAELKEKLNTNSKNSSRPPSSDFKKGKKNKANEQKSNRNQGGQPGHVGHFRSLLPPGEVNHFIVCNPKPQCECGYPIHKVNVYKQHQVHELPLVKPIVTEYQIYDGICKGCGKKHKGELPRGVPNRMLGPIAMSKIATLTGNYRLSKRNAANLLEDFYGLRISIGTISNVEKIVSVALKEACEEVAQSIQKEPIVNVDETGHKELNKRLWTWVAATSSICVFFVAKRRRMEIAQEILGKLFGGILISDRYSSYNWVDFRQLCWSHLKRDFKKFSERDGPSGRIGKGLMIYQKRIFMYWRRVKSGKLSREKFSLLMIPIRSKVETFLMQGTICGHSKTEKTCKNILEYKVSLWTFVNTIGVEPTNNLAERLLRRFVIWRKTSFGTQSVTGSRFVERIMTVSGTCRLQNRNVLKFISDSINSYLNKLQAPSLLPENILSLAA
jgi:transposase